MVPTSDVLAHLKSFLVGLAIGSAICTHSEAYPWLVAHDANDSERPSLAYRPMDGDRRRTRPFDPQQLASVRNRASQQSGAGLGQ
jgi:hypothetical protein